VHLIEPLAVGIAAASLGTVDLLRRGSSTRVTYYTSFEGDGATTPTGSIDLDASGGGVFYVNETTDVVVRDATGEEVRRFVSASAASSVEVISQSFTGTDYDSAATGATKPVPLSTVLDRLFTSFGTTNFNVLVGGTSQTLQSVLSGVASLYFNVKSSAYGATGDGVTDDTAAVQAAFDAAQAAGGGVVFFPRGSYFLDNAVTVGATVSLLGVGPAGSYIFSNGNNLFTMSVGATYLTSVEGLRMVVSGTGIAIDVSAGRRLRVENCDIDAGSASGAAISNAATGTGVLYVGRCRILCSQSYGIRSLTAAMQLHVYGCKFVVNAGATTTCIAAYGGSVIATEFDVSAQASGTTAFITYNAGASGLLSAGAVIGCWSGNPGAGQATAITDQVNRISDGMLSIGNVWGSSVIHESSVSAAAASTYFGQQDFDRERGRYYTADDTGAVAIDAGKYALAEIVRTTTAIQTVTLGTVGAPNRDFTLVYHNSGGVVTGNITMAGPVKNTSVFTVNAASVSYFYFKSVHRGTVTYWLLMGSATNLTP